MAWKPRGTLPGESTAKPTHGRADATAQRGGPQDRPGRSGRSGGKEGVDWAAGSRMFPAVGGPILSYARRAAATDCLCDWS